MNLFVYKHVTFFRLFCRAGSAIREMERVRGTALRKGAGAPTGGGLGVRVPHGPPARMGGKRCPATVQHIHSLTGQRFQKEKG